MKSVRGFTLIELMMTVVIVAILGAIAVPSYIEHVVRGKIAQATENLSEAKVRMEQVFNSNRTYATEPGGTTCPDFSGLFQGSAFSVAIPNCPGDSGTTFTLTATGLAAKGAAGYSYSINQNGDKSSSTPSATGATCWLMSKSASCPP